MRRHRFVSAFTAALTMVLAACSLPTTTQPPADVQNAPAASPAAAVAPAASAPVAGPSRPASPAPDGGRFHVPLLGRKPPGRRSRRPVHHGRQHSGQSCPYRDGRRFLGPQHRSNQSHVRPVRRDGQVHAARCAGQSLLRRRTARAAGPWWASPGRSRVSTASSWAAAFCTKPNGRSSPVVRTVTPIRGAKKRRPAIC